LVGNLAERDHLEDTGLDGKIILRYVFRRRDRAMDWIATAKDRER
jgi:hypothetical protein